jgi:hypothetical protein
LRTINVYEHKKKLLLQTMQVGSYMQNASSTQLKPDNSKKGREEEREGEGEKQTTTTQCSKQRELIMDTPTNIHETMGAAMTMANYETHYEKMQPKKTHQILPLTAFALLPRICRRDSLAPTLLANSEVGFKTVCPANAVEAHAVAAAIALYQNS